jgi:hypothetical protein
VANKDKKVIKTKNVSFSLSLFMRSLIPSEARKIKPRTKAPCRFTQKRKRRGIKNQPLLYEHFLRMKFKRIIKVKLKTWALNPNLKTTHPKKTTARKLTKFILVDFG